MKSSSDTASCDCCGEMVPRDEIGRVVAYGIETCACARCRGEPSSQEAEREERDA